MDEIQIQSRTWAGGDGARAVFASQKIEAQDAFGRALAIAKAPEGTPESQARRAAEDLISTALIGPVFKGLRENNNAAAPFKPNAAERSFGQMLDATLAQRMASSAHWPLVDSVARRLLRKTGDEAGAPKAADTKESARQPAGINNAMAITPATKELS